MSSKFKQLAAKEREVQPRVAIPQIDPADTSVPAETAPAPSPIPSTLEGESVRAPEPQVVEEPASATPTERPVYLTPVDTSEAPFNRGFHMFPSRHRQLLDLAYIEDRRPWEIVEQALAEYVKRHYRGRAGDR